MSIRAWSGQFLTLKWWNVFFVFSLLLCSLHHFSLIYWLQDNCWLRVVPKNVHWRSLSLIVNWSFFHSSLPWTNLCWVNPEKLIPPTIKFQRSLGETSSDTDWVSALLVFSISVLNDDIIAEMTPNSSKASLSFLKWSARPNINRVLTSWGTV